jgi:hypothetical protein
MKTFISKITLLSLALFLFVNCSSGGSSDASATATPTSDYYFECKIDGVLKTFNYRLQTVRYPSFGRKEIGINGSSENSINTVPGFGINIGHAQDNIILVPGTFSNFSYVSVNYFNGSVFNYWNKNDGDLSVTISELNDTFVKGVFSGNLTSRDGANTIITITEGRFYVKHCTSNC